MTNQDNKILRLQVYHQVIGTHNLEVNAKDNFSDLRTLLQQNTPMAIFENFRFQLANKVLPEFQEIGQVIQSDAKIILVLQPFDEKSSLYHLQKIKNIFSNPVEWALLNYNQDQTQDYPQLSDNIKEDFLPDLSVDNFLDEMYNSPLHLPISKIETMINNGQKYYITEGKNTERDFFNKFNHNQRWQFIDTLSFSQFNLSLGSNNFHRKICGDFYYLYIRTLQGKDYHITACPEGFYINNSSCAHFNPSPMVPFITYYNLLDLIKTVSPKFRENQQKLKQIKFSQIQKSLFISFRMKPESENVHEWLRSSNTAITPKYPQKNLYNYNYQNNPLQTSIMGNRQPNAESENQRDTSIIKDWNQIMQIHSTTSYDTDSQLINKNKFKVKLYQEIIGPIRDTATKIVEGVMPKMRDLTSSHTYILNSGQIKNNQKRRQKQSVSNQDIYQYGSLQFWIAQQSINKYDNFEGKMKSKKAVNTQIRNLGIIDKLKLNDIYYRHLLLVKYKGFNIAAQTRVPGVPLTSKNQIIQSDNKTMPKAEKQSILISVARNLKLSQKIIYKKSNSNNQIGTSIIHPEIDIMTGNDNRKYLLNLYGLSARDLNFAGPENSASYLRHQLLDLYNAQPQLYNPVFSNKYRNTPLNTVIQSSYNPIIADKNNSQKQKLIELATFAREIMLPICLKSFENQNRKYLGDSKTVIKVMHAYGLSSRYLGLMWEKAASSSKQCQYIAIVIERVTLVKSFKNVIRKAMRECKSGQYKSLISWLFNCIFNMEFLSQNEKSSLKNQTNFNHEKEEDKERDQSQTTHSKKRKKKLENQKMQKQFQDMYLSFKIHKHQEGAISHGIKPQELWKLTKNVAHFKFGLQFKAEKICDLPCMRSCFGKSAILRDLCISLGIVLERVEYFKKQKTFFRPDNIIEIKPIIKHIKLQNQHFDEMYREAQKLLELKKIEESIDAYIKTIHFAMLNLGVMTQKFVLIHKKLSLVYFRIGQIDASLLFAHHAEKMLEKFYGIDHIQTLENYSMLSQLYFMKRKFNVAEYYLLKMINLAMISYGEEYPELISCFLNLSAIYLVSEKFIDAISCAINGLNLSLKITGEININTAICYAAMSQIHFQIPDIQKSITFQLKVIQILSKIVKKDDNRLKQAENTLEYYRSLQSSKKVRENHDKQRKKFLNSQLYSNFPLFKLPEFTWKERENIYKKMQNLCWNPNRPYF